MSRKKTQLQIHNVEKFLNKSKTNDIKNEYFKLACACIFFPLYHYKNSERKITCY